MTSRISYGILALLPLTLLAVLAEVGAVIVFVQHLDSDYMRLYALPAGLLLGPLWWLAKAMRGTPREPLGEVLDLEENSRLAQEVDAVAHAVGVRAPDRLVVHIGADITARDIDRSLDLCIGLPCLAEQSLDDFRATSAHALAHLASPGDHRLAQAVEWLRLMTAVNGGIGTLLRPYARAYTAVAARRVEALERRADEASARVVGASVTVASMRRLAELRSAWERVLVCYPGLFESANARASLVEALSRVATAGPPKEPIDELPAELMGLITSPHLDLPDRIRTLETGAEGAAPGILTRNESPALSLLSNGQEQLDRVEQGLFGESGSLSSWDAVIADAGSHNIRAVAHQLGSILQRQGIADSSLGGVAGIIEHQGEPGARTLRELLGCDTDDEAAGALDVIVVSALVDAGQAQFVPDWADVMVLHDSKGRVFETVDVARRALEGPDGATYLRNWLLAHDIDLDGPVARPDHHRADWLAAVSHVTGPWKGRRDVHVWSTGMLALPIDPKALSFDKSAYTTSHQRDRLWEASARDLDTARADGGAFWVDRSDVIGGDVDQGMVRAKIRIDLATGVTHQLRTTVESEFLEDVESVGTSLGYLLSIPIEA